MKRIIRLVEEIKNTHYLMLAFSYFHRPSPANYLRHYRT